jgi:mxaA protein
MSRCSFWMLGCRIQGAALAAFLLAWPALSQSQAILESEVTEPRTFGYVVGDKIRREMYLSLRTGFLLDEASLPEAGRIDRWLEVAAPEVETADIAEGKRYHLVLTYQLVNAPQSLETVTVPQQDLHILTAAGEPGAFTTLIPALRVTVAPLTSAVTAERLSVASLQEDRPPAPLAVEGRQTRLTWMMAALFVLSVYAAWRRGALALGTRARLPFATAVRELKRVQDSSGTSADRAIGLKIVHEAINRTAGRAIFAHNLDGFLAAHPAYAEVREEFHQVFAASGRVFFAGATDDAEPGCELPRLLRLCRRCRSIERQHFDPARAAA